MASDEIGIVSGSLSSLEALQTELIEAGFNPSDARLRSWIGPLAEPFRQLTSATTMRLVFQDAWPFRAPKVFVDGIVNEHVNSRGEVCLWTTADSSFEWLTLAGINQRIKLWTERALRGFGDEDLVLDAHLYFENYNKTLALVDVASFKKGPFADDDRGDLYGTIDANETIWICAGLGDSKVFRGRWYFRSKISIPPRNLLTLTEALTTNQRRNFERKLEATRKGGEQAIQLVALIWPTSRGLNVQALKLELTGKEIKATALQVAPTDDESLRLRSGPDSKILSGKRVVLFGVGAIGSHAALYLAEMGVQRLVLIDGDVLRPGNVVRHAATREWIGLNKAVATAKIIAKHSPWTQVEPNVTSPWHPEEIKKLARGADVVLETTGLYPFAAHISTIAEEAGVPFLSVALYRGGKIARLRRQLPARDFPIYRRRSVEKYPIIPPGEDEILGLEAGCSDPIINAPPVSVASAAAMAARVAVDILVERTTAEDEFIEVYERIGTSPFDKLGMIAI